MTGTLEWVLSVVSLCGLHSCNWFWREENISALWSLCDFCLLSCEGGRDSAPSNVVHFSCSWSTQRWEMPSFPLWLPVASIGTVCFLRVQCTICFGWLRRLLLKENKSSILSLFGQVDDPSHRIMKIRSAIFADAWQPPCSGTSDY